MISPAKHQPACPNNQSHCCIGFRVRTLRLRRWRKAANGTRSRHRQSRKRRGQSLWKTFRYYCSSTRSGQVSLPLIKIVLILNPSTRSFVWREVASPNHQEGCRWLNAAHVTFIRQLVSLITVSVAVKDAWRCSIEDFFSLVQDGTPARRFCFEFQLHHRRFHRAKRGAAFSVRLPPKWDALLLEVAIAPTLDSFKRMLDDHWASRFSDVLWKPTAKNVFHGGPCRRPAAVMTNQPTVG